MPTTSSAANVTVDKTGRGILSEEELRQVRANSVRATSGESGGRTSAAGLQACSLLIKAYSVGFKIGTGATISEAPFRGVNTWRLTGGTWLATALAASER
ncbi:hypothetical protein GCM10010170_041680 [Dactylosporangium salmoneum]|uniref:Uncharacterized protein n=1 Tax=Dactylosporangium salmoneum TaxID=53361 RepID=A0ABN3GH61_9ACTN